MSLPRPRHRRNSFPSRSADARSHAPAEASRRHPALRPEPPAHAARSGAARVDGPHDSMKISARRFLASPAGVDSSAAGMLSPLALR